MIDARRHQQQDESRLSFKIQSSSIHTNLKGMHRIRAQRWDSQNVFRIVCRCVTSRGSRSRARPVLERSHLYHSTSYAKAHEPVVVTDEGVVIHQADPATSGNGLGVVWGSVLWPSGICLAKYGAWRLLHDCDYTNPRRILELGCGTGVVGFTMATTWSKESVCSSSNLHLTLTDCETALWPLLRRSITANDLTYQEATFRSETAKLRSRNESAAVSIHELDWRDTSTFLLKEKFDLIVAADVLYSGMDKLFARALASHLPIFSVEEPVEAWVASPFRKGKRIDWRIQ